MWVEGFAFSELSRRQEGVAELREELERQKKALSKLRPSPGGQAGGVKGQGSPKIFPVSPFIALLPQPRESWPRPNLERGTGLQSHLSLPGEHSTPLLLPPPLITAPSFPPPLPPSLPVASHQRSMLREMRC